MKNIIKFLSVILIFSLGASLMMDWYKTFVINQYFAHASLFLSVLVGVGVPCAICLGTFYAIKLIINQ